MWNTLKKFALRTAERGAETAALVAASAWLIATPPLALSTSLAVGAGVTTYEYASGKDAALAITAHPGR